ncbi:rod shape-determining protein MreC [Parvularcula lutaonensis]|uniref:Cell shape-determining protein MreC n=1 Tax=Parvularcula lutaonensis TaxID=491923 RepID=A0ABV7MD67_9PROT|nr:rod shape-determining protein MreC [Parvularcula lutaonensis]GGY52488.1 cell shape-determining protein MreC [Parvularcula lutaonensis]
MSALFTKSGAAGFRDAERPPANLLAMLGLSLFLTVFSIYGAQASVFEKARESLLDRFEPVLGIFSAPVRFVGNRIGDIGDYFAVMEENERLREENEQLRIWMNQAMALEQRLAEYEALLDPKVVEPKRYIPAQVIAENGGPFSRALILSAGRKDGIRRGSAVVDGNGLIGHVVSTGQSASRVLLLTDANSHVPVYIEAVDTEGLLSGTAERRAEIRQFSGRPKGELKVGMRVVTSGTGGSLPRGIPVGEIVSLTEDGVEVGLYASDQGAHLVRVVDYVFPDPDEPAEDESDDEPSAGGAVLSEAEEVSADG